ncbi:ABC transporter substrate-binding protein [Streptomyces angustmyceticus]|uniref:ABC transporter substrate-binding protein n=1 Tax=Streptomyces angustmyceticus TaxID=285578 RepID=A0A5J4L6V0_9ACTN|nr:extracellular solute-binding protein [Streptomyces angustmyceticus]GES29873.1 ABC transporter substrate-binding protein [Streptomyces angustmyceticus]
MAAHHRVRTTAALCCLGLVTLGLVACQEGGPTRPVAPSRAGSAAEAGGTAALIRAAKKEGRLNAIALPRQWANYGGLINGFEKKYGIKVVVDDPNGHSSQEIEALKRYRGRQRAPDVIDVADTFAQSAARQNLLAPYRVAQFDEIPPDQKDAGARWYNNYGGYISIGCDASRVRNCPESFADLLRPEYKGLVSIHGDPAMAGSAFAAVYAAALANGGSFDNIQPGIDFFARLDKAGNYHRAEPGPATIAAGRTPVIIEWDYLNLQHIDRLRGTGVKWKVSIPFDGSFSQYYALAINKYAPHPAAARLWQEYLFSPEGQNLRLVDYARPVLMAAMAKNGTLDKALAARLPTVEGTPQFPTEAQLNKALRTVRAQWAKAVGG